MSRTFEMSASGPLSLGAVVECGVCWWTYDPGPGAPEHDLLPGVGFSDLPATFRCPECDASKDKFMLKPGAASSAPAAIKAPTNGGPIPTMAERLNALEAAYTKSEDAMVGLPIHNPKLIIESIGFRETDEGYVGVVITPWSMNIAVLPKDPAAQPHGPIGAEREVTFPSGTYSFLSARLDDFGALETCNLISPMDEFDDPAVARMTAEAALDGLFTAPDPSQAVEEDAGQPFGPEAEALAEAEARAITSVTEADGRSDPVPSRRAFLGGGRVGTGSGKRPGQHGAPGARQAEAVSP